MEIDAIQDLISVDNFQMEELRNQFNNLNTQYEISCLAAAQIEITKKDIQEMKSFVNPPKAISEVISIIMHIFDFPKKDAESWDKQKKVLSDIKFFDKMKKYEFDQVKKVKLDKV